MISRWQSAESPSRVGRRLIRSKATVSFGGLDDVIDGIAEPPKRIAAMGADARIAELKLELPPAPKPVATYVTAVRHGDVLYVSGHGPAKLDKPLVLGKLGDNVTIEQGKQSARLVGINNRNLRTFVTRLEHTLDLMPQVPADCCLVSESGIRERADVLRLQAAGVRAILVGESLMAAADVGLQLQRLLGLVP